MKFPLSSDALAEELQCGTGTLSGIYPWSQHTHGFHTNLYWISSWIHEFVNIIIFHLIPTSRCVFVKSGWKDHALQVQAQDADVQLSFVGLRLNFLSVRDNELEKNLTDKKQLSCVLWVKYTLNIVHRDAKYPSSKEIGFYTILLHIAHKSTSPISG